MRNTATLRKTHNRIKVFHIRNLSFKGADSPSLVGRVGPSKGTGHLFGPNCLIFQVSGLDSSSNNGGRRF